ncbi:MAG: TIGR02569 family protein [Actinobacteria bacterium]|nr:TIGR02569 family protein [Actinomycetota bacterium]
MSAPPDEVLAAFVARPGSAVRLEGGEGNAWRAGSIVLKPVNNAAVVEWLATTIEEVDDGEGFRMSRHVPANDGRWVVEGWAATTWLEGATASGRWDELLATSGAFHAAIRSVPAPPDGVLDRQTPWSVGDRVAWGEEEPAECPGEVGAVIDRLRPLVDTPWTGAPAQVIHGDIGGNVLFAEDLAPAVIDVSPYVRPAALADAVAVVDAIAWEAAPLTLAMRFGMTENGDQLLARAVVYRVVAAAVAFPDLPQRISGEVDAYSKVLTALRGI